MTKYSQNQYADIFQKLPAPLKDVVSASATSEKIRKIGERHRLQVDQIGNLIDLVLDAVMGIISVKNLLDAIKKEVNVDPQDAVAILNDVNEEIFKPVREIIERTYNGGSPNKPRTLATAEEDDEEHLHLTKHDVLKEIESPGPAIVRSIPINPIPPTVTPSPAAKVPKVSEKNPVKISTSKEIEEYHQELKGNKIDITKIKPIEPAAAPEEVKVAVPITPSVVMPSAKNVVPAISVASMKLGGTSTTESATKAINDQMPPNISAPKAYPTDPYREPPTA